jgi:hypothetical protein
MFTLWQKELYEEGEVMKCNYKPPKLTKEEQAEFASIKSTLPYIDRLQIKWRNSESKEEETEKGGAE